MIGYEIESEYLYEDFFIYHMNEADPLAKWQTRQSTNYKKGLRRYRNDSVVTKAIKEIVAFIESHDKIPQISTYPPQYNVHLIKRDKRFSAGTLWTHLKGQKIGMLFKIEHGPEGETPGLISLIHLGTHQQLGWR